MPYAGSGTDNGHRSAGSTIAVRLVRGRSGPRFELVGVLADTAVEGEGGSGVDGILVVHDTDENKIGLHGWRCSAQSGYVSRLANDIHLYRSVLSARRKAWVVGDALVPAAWRPPRVASTPGAPTSQD